MATKQQRQNNTNMQDDMKAIYCNLLENIRVLSAKYEMYTNDLACATGMTRRTFILRKKSPWLFTLLELEMLAAVFHTDVSTLLFGEVKPVRKEGLA